VLVIVMLFVPGGLIEIGRRLLSIRPIMKRDGP
jgi:hypothetical protein